MPGARAVVITGCSSGIGRAVAEHLISRDYAVYATARRVDDLGDLAAAGAYVLRVDVADERSMRECVRQVEDRHGAVWGLVNNAGYALTGPVEDIDMGEVRRQFEVNVFGQLTMARLALPAMRSRGEGRIVNVSSVAGRFTFPGGGCYHASKHALTSFSDALRFEVKPFGIYVSTIEPGAVGTRFIDTALELLTRGAAAGEAPEYAPFRRDLAHCYQRVRNAPRRYGVGPPQKVARAVEHALRAPVPRPRYPVGAVAHVSLGLRRLLPQTLFDTLVRSYLPVPRREG
ncbi:SDR family NAD(P)-dependent oxidoreductase [Streptomyces alboniger]|nr:SDR family NAD(P)-dependent oxidoreductase [Streptomyces alboniger]